ncbi:MAG: indole-3-glycerol phosphate synthase TrpC [Alphaproteobacteria bacterium]|nr:indole-3-glycerol phosphate synthase TrpC [Alphaproteobacteria bacterium]
MSVLDEICVRKAEHVAAQKNAVSLDELKAQIKDAEAPRGFIQALRAMDGPSLIAEVKKASPSKGLIRADFDPAVIAKTYEDNGAACISVLTDEPYFQGCDAYLRQVKDVVSLPVLRKDFMLDPYQIYESRALGADCILLIMAALSDDMADELYGLAVDLGMDVLVEVHNAKELERALRLNPAMVGVNNRNLKTLSVDVQTSFDLLPQMPPDVLKVAESGLSNYETVYALEMAGYTAFLVGESLMRQDDIGAAVRGLLGKN